jgi:hypothetical protein
VGFFGPVGGLGVGTAGGDFGLGGDFGGLCFGGGGQFGDLGGGGDLAHELHALENVEQKRRVMIRMVVVVVEAMAAMVYDVFVLVVKPFSSLPESSVIFPLGVMVSSVPLPLGFFTTISYSLT